MTTLCQQVQHYFDFNKPLRHLRTAHHQQRQYLSNKALPLACRFYNPQWANVKSL